MYIHIYVHMYIRRIAVVVHQALYMFLELCRQLSLPSGAHRGQQRCTEEQCLGLDFISSVLSLSSCPGSWKTCAVNPSSTRG